MKKGSAYGPRVYTKNREDIITAKILERFNKKVKALWKTGRVLLVGHDSPDPDVFGNIIAWKHYFSKKWHADADALAVFRGERSLQNQAIMKFLGVNFIDQKFYEENAEHYDLVMFLDTRRGHTSLAGIKPDIVWDHHKEEEISNGCLVVFEELGAASTLSYLFFQAEGMVLPEDVVLGLAIGIDRDTRSLQDEGATDVDAQILQELISKMAPEGFRIFNYLCHYPPISIDSVHRRGRAYNSVKNERNVVFAFLGETQAEDDNSYGIIADDLIRIQGVELAIVAGIREGRDLRASVRVDSATFDYEKILKEIFKTDFYTGASSGGKNKSAGGGLIPFTSFEKGLLKREETKQMFMEEKERQIWSDIQKFIAATASSE